MKQLFSTARGRRQRLTRLFKVVILLIFAGAVMFLLNQNFWAGTAISCPRDFSEFSPDSWVFKQGEQVLNDKLMLPCFQKLEAGNTYSISTQLQFDGSRVSIPACFFYVDHMYCKVLLDGASIFSYTPEEAPKPDRSESPGNVYVAALLPEDCMGKTIEIQFTPSLSSGIEYEFPNPTFSDYSCKAIRTFWQDLPHNLIAILFAGLGICSLLYSTLALAGPQYREGMAIGAFAVLFSLYNITESTFDFYVISNPYYTYVLDYTTFSLIPIFLIAFLRERLDPRQQKFTLIMILLDLAMYLVEVVLHFSGTMDMREFLPVLHITYFAELVILFFLMITMKNTPRKSQLIFQMIPILIGMLIDAAIYYLHWTRFFSDSTFTAIGVVIFLFVELRYVWKCSINVYMESVRSQEYRQMAFIDALSGICNRRSYEAEISAVTSGQKKFSSLIVISADINDLKPTNDTLGHAAGDFLIRNAADVLSDVAAFSGPVFRTGGDEFSIFLYNTSQKELKKRLQKMDVKIKSINSNSDAKLSLAVGYEPYDGKDLESAIQLADKKMYEHKSQYKAQRDQKL